MKKILLLLLFAAKVFGQDLVVKDSIPKTNPIVFTETYFGFAGSDNGGLFTLGINLNYQFNKRDLLTARVTSNFGVKNDYLLVSTVTPIPVFVRKETQFEYAFLYGKRFIFDNYSVSLSTGVSFVNRDFYRENDDVYEEANQEYFGVPLEINIKFFKSKKSRFRAYYGIIPIGKKKVSFGRSAGFKLIGNIAKNNYVGLAFTYGFGWHKKY